MFIQLVNDMFIEFSVSMSVQAGSLVGLCLMEELCPTTTLKKMRGKVARAALKFPFVKSKVCEPHRVPMLQKLFFFL